MRQPCAGPHRCGEGSLVEQATTNTQSGCTFMRQRCAGPHRCGEGSLVDRRRPLSLPPPQQVQLPLGRKSLLTMLTMLRKPTPLQGMYQK